MRIENEGRTLIADEGKVLMCTCHNVILGKEVYLKEIMRHGVLEVDSADNYVEVDEPEREEMPRHEEEIVEAVVEETVAEETVVEEEVVSEEVTNEEE